MSSIEISKVNAYLEKQYRTGYEDTSLLIPPVALPAGTYQMDRSSEPAEGAIFFGDARLTPVTGISARGRDDMLEIVGPNSFAYAPYSDTQFFIANIIQQGDELVEDETLYAETVNIYADSVGVD